MLLPCCDWLEFDATLSQINEIHVHPDFVNSLTFGRFQFNFRLMIFKLILVIDGWGISCEIALRWMSLYLGDDKSTWVKITAWCHLATSHYLIFMSQLWKQRSLLLYSITRLQWVNSLCPIDAIWWHKYVNIGSGNGLVPGGNKPLPEPVLNFH